MKKILNIEQAVKISNKLKNEKKGIVLAGGAFDILHLGHVRFLEKAKQEGDFLFVLLESDKSVRKIKGKKRPINIQADRAEVLAALYSVDFIVKLKGVLKDQGYDKIVRQISPNVLATTGIDSYIFHKIRQAKLVKAKVKIVTRRIKNKSTTKILGDE